MVYRANDRSSNRLLRRCVILICASSLMRKLAVLTNYYLPPIRARRRCWHFARDGRNNAASYLRVSTPEFANAVTRISGGDRWYSEAGVSLLAFRSLPLRWLWQPASKRTLRLLRVSA